MQIERCPRGHFFDADRYDLCPLCPPERENFQPVTGWLVCMDEPFRGRDFRLHEGAHILGSGPQADISLCWDPDAREQEALLCLDEETGLFTFGPKRGGSAAVNGKPVEHPVVLRPGDCLTVGATRLRFVPLEQKENEESAGG